MRRSFLGAMALSVAVYATAAHAIDRDFTVENHIGGSIRELYVSPTSVNRWGPDQLGSHVIEDGGSFTLHFNPSTYRGQCQFDIKLVEADGDQSVLNGINLCTITHVTFSRNGSGHVVYSARNGE